MLKKIKTPNNFEEFKEIIKNNNPHLDLELIKKAYNFAKEKHKNQVRRSGEPFFNHLINVAIILSQIYADTKTIVAGLLHDVLEDTNTKKEEITKEFSEEISNMVEAITKISERKESLDNMFKNRAETIRKIILATTKDYRVILIKLADRLHNMRTLKYLPEEKQKIIAKETLDIYAPIAHKLGMYSIKSELEDLCLKYLDRHAYDNIAKLVAKNRELREKEVNEIVKIIKELLEKNKINAEVYGRAKSFYSIYKKMKTKGKSFDQIYDILAIRIITNTIEECYKILAIIHSNYRAFPERFKDYIATPKYNMYQSIHTQILVNGFVVEVQIRTWQMHYYAEEGIAAHWRYKGDETDSEFDKRLAWLKEIMEWLKDYKDANEFIDKLKIDVFKNEIFVFTPKGDIINLPEKSTPIDFAYKIHTDVGNKCVKAKVNGKLVPLDYILKSGDIVEIITSKNAKPSRSWLKFVVTQLARKHIKQALDIESEYSGNDDKSLQKIDLSLIDFPNKKQLEVAKCCDPKNYDEIVGYKTKDGKIVVHKEDCINIERMDKSKMIKLNWLKQKSNKYHILLDVKNEMGLLAKILSIISKYYLNIEYINTRPIRSGFNVDIIVESKEISDELNYKKIENLKNEIKKIDSVISCFIELLNN